MKILMMLMKMTLKKDKDNTDVNNDIDSNETNTNNDENERTQYNDDRNVNAHYVNYN